MPKLTRRDWMKGALATIAGTGAVSTSSNISALAAQPASSAGKRKNRIKLALMSSRGDLQT